MAPKKAAPPPPEPEPEPEPEPPPEEPPSTLVLQSHVVPELTVVNTFEDWEAFCEEVGDGLSATCIAAPGRCAASRKLLEAFEVARNSPAFATAAYATVDIDTAEEYFITSRGIMSVPCVQFVKNGYVLTQFLGGDPVRLRAELTRLLASLRL